MALSGDLIVKREIFMGTGCVGVNLIGGHAMVWKVVESFRESTVIERNTKGMRN